MLTAKTEAGRRPIYVNSLRQYLARFAQQFGARPIGSVSTPDVLAYLAPFRGHSRSTHLNRVSALFAYAFKQGWCEGNPCDRIERVTIDAKPIRILSPEEATNLYHATPTVCRPYLVVCLYAGVRPTEARRLDWKDVDLVHDQLIIGAAASKVRARRVVPLPAKAVALLQAHPHKLGPLAPSHSTIRRWQRKLRPMLGQWDADILRHTALSYHLAYHRDIGLTATIAGNSPTILKLHYDALASRQQAELFYQPSPP